MTGDNFSSHNHQRKTTDIVAFCSAMGDTSHLEALGEGHLDFSHSKHKSGSVSSVLYCFNLSEQPSPCKISITQKVKRVALVVTEWEDCIISTSHGVGGLHY